MKTLTVKKVERYFAKIGLRELITEKHGKKVPETTIKTKTIKQLK